MTLKVALRMKQNETRNWINIMMTVAVRLYFTELSRVIHTQLLKKRQAFPKGAQGPYRIGRRDYKQILSSYNRFRCCASWNVVWLGWTLQVRLC